jgi:hypothetical protein
MTRTVALYWHNGRSLGHTSTIAKVARHLLRSPEPYSVAGITGAYHGLDLLPAEVYVVKIPSFANFDDPTGWNLRPRLAVDENTLHRVRAELITTFLRHYRPEVLMSDHIPRGTDDELVPALEARYAQHAVLSLRGVLFDRDKTLRKYFGDPGRGPWVLDHYCQFNVHTHPEVFDLADYYAIPQEAADRLHYTGYLAEPYAVPRDEARRRIGVGPGDRLIAAEQRGAHDPAHLRSPAHLLRELTPLPPALRMVTLAPELPGADELIAHLVAHGVQVSAGHSSATPEQLEHARRLGLSHLAHLWSGQSALTRPALHRLPGLLEASLASGKLTAEIIADGHHLPAALLTIALRCLGPERLCLVSDATAGTGLAPGTAFRTGASLGRVHDGYAATEDHTSLCGSVTPLAVTVARMRELTGARVEDVLTMATATPARVAGLYPRKGSMLPGADGDVVLFGPDLRVRTVVLAGTPVTSAALPDGGR